MTAQAGQVTIEVEEIDAGIVEAIADDKNKSKEHAAQQCGTGKTAEEVAKTGTSSQQALLRELEVVVSCVPKGERASSAELRRWLMALMAVRRFHGNASLLETLNLKPRWIEVVSLINGWACKIIGFVEVQPPSRREAACRAWLRRFVSNADLHQFDDSGPLSRVDDLMSWIFREHRQLARVERRLRKSQLRNVFTWRACLLTRHPVSLPSGVAAMVLAYLRPSSDAMSTGSVTTYWDRLLARFRDCRVTDLTHLLPALRQVQQRPHTFHDPMPNWF